MIMVVVKNKQTRSTTLLSTPRSWPRLSGQPESLVLMSTSYLTIPSMGLPTNAQVMLMSVKALYGRWQTESETTSLSLSVEKQVNNFKKALENGGVTASVRSTRGLEVNAACGQLRNRFQSKPLQLDDWS